MVFVLLFLLLFVVLIKSPSPNVKLPDTNSLQRDVNFNMKTNKQDLTRLINHYLKEKYSGSINYKVLLTNEVEFYGEIPIFNENVEMKLTFEAKALENGDLELKQKKLTIGKWRLPVQLVLKFIQTRYTLPEWVIVQPNEEKVYIELQKMKTKNDLKVSAVKFDLISDDIEFSLHVPME